MGSQLNISLAQVEVSSDPMRNLDTANSLASRAAGEQSDLIVLPEMFMAVPGPEKRPVDYAEDLHGQFVNRLCEIASGNSIYLLAGIWEKVDSVNKAGNTLVLISPAGELKSAYRKVHLFDSLNKKESDTMQEGGSIPELCYVKDFLVGCGICYDLRFPELFRMQSLKGAELLILPSAWYQDNCKEEQWMTLLRARALENTVFVAGCNQVGEKFSGRSALVDPFGVVLTDLGEASGLRTVSINKDRLLQVRDKLPVLNHCRHDIYDLSDR
ncbi:MAG: carbon-nitrogen hydrolase family protein [Thermodesulfobacteriota bacterium]